MPGQKNHDNSAIPHSDFFNYEAIVLNENALEVIRASAGSMHRDTVWLPVQLDELPQDTEYQIIAEPIKD